MILLYIYLGISVLCLVMYTLATFDFTYKFKKKYPGLKTPRQSLSGRILSVIKGIVASFIPILNLALVWVIVFEYGELETRTLNKIYQECLKEERGV